ncbi:MAG TPA: phosphotransferase family protein [Acidimicrobiales bacterium]|nr:phosphotransferase family protein [Acidimicrobiales bacterium]
MADLAEGLAAFLSKEWDRPVEITGLAASSAGARRANVAFDADDGRLVHPLVATIVPTAAIQLNPIGAEAAVRTLARDHGVPVPEVVGWSEDESWVGGPFFLSERVDGETVPRQVLRLVDQQGIGDLVAHQLGQAMGRLHSIDPAVAPPRLLDLGAGAPAERALAGLEAAMGTLLEPRPALSLGLKWLERHLPPAPPTSTIVHTDIRTGNLIVGADGLRAVLDWEGARRGGDPMEDVAWMTLRMWRFRNDDREIGGLAGRPPFLEGYGVGGGEWHEERCRWWKVYGTLKWGLGLAAQAAGHLDGSFRSIIMAASGRRVPEMEWDLLMLIKPGR